MIKLTKNELRLQQNKLQLLYKYLPTLQLKKAMLQAEVSEAKSEIATFTKTFESLKNAVNEFSSLLTDHAFDLKPALKVKELQKRYENIAGVEIPVYENVIFESFDYSLFDTPVWFDSAIASLKQLVIAKERITVAEEKKTALENELREVSIRVNLFEKILIPRALDSIKKIKVFLGDQQLAAVSRAKVAKVKIGKSACELM